jgi:hypothetical protein
MNEDELVFEPSHEEHRRAQRLRWARETTAEQRLVWLEGALEFVYASGIDYLAQREMERSREVPPRGPGSS